MDTRNLMVRMTSGAWYVVPTSDPEGWMKEAARVGFLHIADHPFNVLSADRKTVLAEQRRDTFIPWHSIEMCYMELSSVPVAEIVEAAEERP